jgi:hypothetical protein
MKFVVSKLLNYKMENTVYIKQIQGHADHGWLQANFSFSFGSWYNPDRIQFGALRVLMMIGEGMGFGPSRQYGNHHNPSRRRFSSQRQHGKSHNQKW